jgi:hypothetical protein
MATNPKLPDFPNIPPRRSGDDHAKVQMIRKSKFPWPILMLIVVAALIIAIISILPRGPKTTQAPTNAEIPPQPTASQVQFSDFQIVPTPAGGASTTGAVYLDAMLHNAGTTAITGVQVSATFVGKNGTLKTVTAPVQNMPGATKSQDLVTDPIKPNESRRVSIYVERPPTGWNHQPPQITVENVSATTP